MSEPLIKDEAYYARLYAINRAFDARDGAAAEPVSEPEAEPVIKDQDVKEDQDVRDEPAATVAVVPELPPAPGPDTQINPAKLFAVVRGYLAHYARWSSEAQLDAATLWVLHTHNRDASGVLRWDATPRLMLLSSEPGSGKSRVLELLGWLCPATNGLDTELTAAALTWTLSSEHATVLLDETDILFGAGKRNVAVRAILNAGYRTEGTVLRMRGGNGVRQRVFGPIAMAGLDVMQRGTSGRLDALFSRAIVIRMRKAEGSVPALDDKGRRSGERIKAALARWAQEQSGDLDAEPELPEFLENRQAEIWGPLIACGLNCGGEAYNRAISSARELTQFADAEIPAAEDSALIMAELEEIAAEWGQPVAAIATPEH